MPANFHNWGAEGYGEGLTRTWVGIMGDSADELPLVGGVPDKEGVYIAAGVCGAIDHY
jgi:glycine/D-amino acid oxidase-like deaminating enzyme